MTDQQDSATSKAQKLATQSRTSWLKQPPSKEGEVKAGSGKGANGNAASVPKALQSLRARLLVTIAAALSPVLVIAGWRAYLDSRNTIQDRQEELILASDNAIDWIEKSVASAESLLAIFSDDIAEDRCSETMARIKPVFPYVQNIVHYGVTGLAKCTARGEPGYEIQDRYWHAQLRDGRVTLRTGAFIGVESDEWSFASLHRLEDENGEFAGSASIGINIYRLMSAMPAPREQDDIEVALVDSDGNVFGSVRFQDGRALDVRKAVQSNETMLDVVDDNEGDPYDRVIRPIGEGGIYAMVSRPAPGIVSEFTLRPAVTIGLPILTFLLTLIAVWFAIEHLILKWFWPLRRMTAAYAVGKYDYTTDASFEEAPQEISKLSSILENMARRIGQRDEELHEAIAVRDAAVKEIHHRVKNNLQIVSSFVRLQMRPLEDTQARRVLGNVRNRIDALSIVHQTLYQHERLEYVQMRPFFDALLEHLQGALGIEEFGGRLRWNIAEVERVSDDAIPMALFVLEAITNSVKYALETGDGEEISVTLIEDGDDLVLSIQDDGKAGKVGESSSGLGSKLMTAFARQLSAELTQAVNERGYHVELRIPPR